MKERILVLTRLAPWTLAGGARIRNHWMIRALAARYRVDLVLTEPHVSVPQEYVHMLESVEVIPPTQQSWGARVRDALVKRQPLYAAGIVSERLQTAVANLLARHRYLAIQTDLNMQAAIPETTTVPIVYNAHNCETALQRRHARAAGLPLGPLLAWDARRLAEFERRMLERSALITACSLDDLRDLHALALRADERAVLIPNGVDLAHYRDIREDAFEPRRLLITGSMDWRPNQQGLFWFLDEVLPFLHAHDATLTVRVAGRMDAAFAQKIARYPGITAIAHPADLREELERAQLILAPITASSGTRLRILEAWAAGRPVVTTHFGAMGLEYEDGRELLTCDTPQTFVDAIVTLLNSPEQWHAIRNAAKQRVVQYDWAPIGEQLLAAYERLSP